MPRPKKPDAEKLEQRSHRLLPAHWAEFYALGGIEWLRAKLAKSMRMRRRSYPPAR